MFTFFLIVLFMDAAFVNQIVLEPTSNDEACSLPPPDRQSFAAVASDY